MSNSCLLTNQAALLICVRAWGKGYMTRRISDVRICRTSPHHFGSFPRSLRVADTLRFARGDEWGTREPNETTRVTAEMDREEGSRWGGNERPYSWNPSDVRWPLARPSNCAWKSFIGAADYESLEVKTRQLLSTWRRTGFLRSERIFETETKTARNRFSFVRCLVIPTLWKMKFDGGRVSYWIFILKFHFCNHAFSMINIPPHSMSLAGRWKLNTCA